MTPGTCWASTGCASEVRYYLTGWACLAHSPAVLSGRTAPTPNPGLTIRGLIEAANHNDRSEP